MCRHVADMWIKYLQFWHNHKIIGLENIPLKGPGIKNVKECTAGDEGPVGDLSSESIFAHFQGLLTSIQLAVTK